jgi:hypothetical protein
MRVKRRTYIELNLDFFLQFSLEAPPDNFSLTRFEAVRHRRDRADVVGHREKDKLPVDKIGIRNLIRVVVEIRVRLHIFGAVELTSLAK